MSKGFKRILSIYIGIVVVAILFVSYLTNSLSNNIGDTKSKYEVHLGEVKVIDSDTLTIVDYSIFNETFTLSDGRVINSKLIMK